MRTIAGMERRCADGLTIMTRMLRISLLCVVLTGRSQAQTVARNPQTPPPATAPAPVATSVSMNVSTAAPTSKPQSDAPADIETLVGKGSIAERTGAFTYSLPITMPPDPFGLAPELSLVYDSQTSNGLLGVGWRLGGLSAISTCQRTPSDGAFGPNQYDGSDPFCLDGSRLVDFAGPHGTDGSEYRTEQEEFARVKSQGAVGGGPERFMIATKKRVVASYGGTPDSRIEVPGSATAFVWAVDRTEDLSGNFAAYSYHETNGSYQIARIDYTGHIGTRIVPRRSARFVYEARPDSYVVFIGGQRTVEDKRLARIETFIDDRKILTYVLEYDVSPNTRRSRLTRISKCASSSCLPPTTIQWAAEASDPNLMFEGNLQDDDVHGSAELVALADVNGDGLPDYVCKNADDCIHWNLNTGTGWLPGFRQTGLTALGSVESWFIDINRDGKADFVAYDSNGLMRWNLAAGDGTAEANFAPTRDQRDLPLQGTQRWLADVNGDGFPDFVVKNNNQDITHWVLGTGNGFERVNRSQNRLCDLGDISTNNDRLPPPKSWVVDINGDGKADYVSFRSGSENGTLCWNYSVGDGTGAHWGITQRKVVPGNARAFATLADINGDGLPDYVTTEGSTLHWNVNTGTGWTANLRQDHLHGFGHRLFGPQFVDINGDGKADYVVKNDNDVIHWDLAIGDGTTNQHWGSPQRLGGLHRFGVDIFSNQFHGFASWFRDINGDGKADFVSKDAIGRIRWNLAATTPTDHIVGMRTPLGAEIRVNYQSLAGPAIHKRDFNAVFPLVDIQPPVLAVNELSLSDGIGGSRTTRFRYAGAKIDFGRRQSSGLREIVREDLTTGNTSQSTFLQAFPLDGRLQSREERLRTGVVSERVVNAWRAERRTADHTDMALLESRLAETFELDGTRVAFRRKTYTYGDFANVEEETDLDSGNVGRTATTVYKNDPARWILGLPERREVVLRGPSTTDLRRLTTRTFDTTGRLMQEVLQPGMADSRTTDFQYDSRGEVTSTTLTAAGGPARVTLTSFDPFGFIATTKNAVGHDDLYEVDPACGHPLRHTAPDLTVTRSKYDDFGRVTERLTEGQPGYTWEYTLDPSAGGLTVVRTETRGETRTSRFDVLGRTQSVTTLDVQGLPVSSEWVWDSRGRLARQSRPHFASSAPLFDQFEYDDLDRRISTTLPGGQVTRVEFNGLRQRTWDPLGHSTTQTYNAQGWLVDQYDAVGAAVRYSYDPAGNVLNVIDTKGTMTAFVRDIYGNITSMSDPGQGNWTLAYNGFGELAQQTDARGDTTRFERDGIGRVTRETRGSFIASREYDRGTGAAGKISSSSTSEGFSDGFSYDRYGRLLKETVAIAGRQYAVEWTYNADGRVETILYPDGFSIRHLYAPNGFLSEIQDATTNKEIWRALRYDAEGRVVESALGNGVLQVRTLDPSHGRVLTKSVVGPAGNRLQDFVFAYDQDRNLLARRENVAGWNENFSYDVLNRLVSWTRVSNGGAITALAYDLDGNILSKSAVGNYYYGLHGSGPHALSLLARPGKQEAIAYDANGRWVSGLERKLHYGVSSLPDQASFKHRSDRLNWWRQESFGSGLLYDGDDRRIQKTTRRAKGIGPFKHDRRTVTTDYVKGLFERTQWKCGELQRSFVRAGADLVAVSVQVEDRCKKDRALGPQLAHLQPNPRASDILFVHTDHVGSIAGVSGAGGVLVDAPRYDPFGSLLGLDDRIAIAGVNRGLAGLEHDRDLDLINMRGRLFDPRIARFLSADPDRQFPRDGQASNRYAYARNNPLRYTDSTGFRVDMESADSGGGSVSPDSTAREYANETANEHRVPMGGEFGAREAATDGGSLLDRIKGPSLFDPIKKELRFLSYDDQPIFEVEVTIDVSFGSGSGRGPSFSVTSGDSSFDVKAGSFFFGVDTSRKMQVGLNLVPKDPFKIIEKLADVRPLVISYSPETGTVGIGASARGLGTRAEVGATGRLGSGVTRMMEDLHGNVTNTLLQDVWSPDGW